MIKIYSFILLAILSFPVSSEHSFLGRFLASTAKDSVIVSQRNHIKKLDRTSFSMPFIGDAEVRIRNRAFDFGGQRYTLKIEPRGIGETKALLLFKKSQKQYEEKHYRYMLNEFLMLRYIYFIDMLERKSLADGYKELITIYEDRINVMEKLKNSTDFDMTDLIKAEKDLAKMLSEHIEESQEVSTANRYMQSQINDSLGGQIDTAGLITVEAIKKELDSIELKIDENNIYLSDLEEEYKLSRLRYDLEKAQARKIISFLEFSYDYGSLLDEYARRDALKNYNLYNAYIFELGVKIPWMSNRNDDVSRRQIDFLRDREEYLSLHKEMTAKIDKDVSDLQAYIERYELFNIRETEADAEASLKKYLEMSGVDPLVLLTIQESLVKNRMEKEKVYFSILRNYIYIMDVSGKLTQEPIRNFLSGQYELLE
ncbi:MAG TPA: hypothetical protein VHP36_05710 [Chitinispirillaceae bacterium]|nr:hypothetical protein [Chitinispirillaceae bacterium]